MLLSRQYLIEIALKMQLMRYSPGITGNNGVAIIESITIDITFDWLGFYILCSMKSCTTKMLNFDIMIACRWQGSMSHIEIRFCYETNPI